MGQSTATTKDLWGNERRVGVPLSVVAFATDPLKLLVLWASLKRQTYRNFEFVLVNQARGRAAAEAIKEVFETVIRKDHGSETEYVCKFKRFAGVWKAKHQTVMLCDQSSQFEPGHIESLLRKEGSAGKRAVASFCVLGEHGGFDAATLKANRATSKQGNFRLGMFLMNKTEIVSVQRDMRRDFGDGYHVRLEAEFLKRYWRKYLAKGRSVGTLLPTQIVAHSREMSVG